MAFADQGPEFDDSQLDELVKEFEQEIERGDSPTVDEYLPRVPAGARPALLERLLVMDYIAWNANGGRQTVEDYKRRYPEYEELVERVLLQAAGSRGCEYIFIRRLGEGASGEVYLARDSLGRDVAIKLLRPSFRASEASLRRFVEEMSIVARLKPHRNVVTFYQKQSFAIGNEEVTAAVLQYLPGLTLRQVLAELISRKQTLGVGEAVRIVLGIVDGLVHLQKGKLQAHRDLKPENIILDSENCPVITDFGMATLLASDDGASTLRGGTFAYMAPEQVRHFLGNHREALYNCDIWAIGVILYECLTGQQPFRDSDRDELFWHIENTSPVPPRRLREGSAFNAALERICLKCLEKNPEDRYSTAVDLREELGEWLSRHQRLPALQKEIRSFADVRKQYEDFVPRPSVTGQVKHFLQNATKGVMIIAGPPGKGKSAIAVHLEKWLEEQGFPSPIGFFFRKQTADPEMCVRHLLATLIIQSGCPDDDVLPADGESALAERALRTQLQKVAGNLNGSNRLVVILDALDEGRTSQSGSSPYDLLARVCAELPEFVYVIATSRNCPALRAIDFDVPCCRLDLDAPDYLPQYRREVRNYIEQKLSGTWDSGFDAQVIDRIAQFCDGNYLVARLACNELLEAKGSRQTVEAILPELLTEQRPDRLGYLYQRYTRRLLDRGQRPDGLSGVLLVLAHAEADLTPALIRSAAGLTVEAWRAVRAVLDEFLFVKPAEPASAQEERIRLFHTSFQDYLRQQVYVGDEGQAHRLLSHACQSYESYGATSKEYALRYGVRHAVEAGNAEIVIRRINDFGFFEAKATAGLAASLKQDLQWMKQFLQPRQHPACPLLEDFGAAIWESLGFLTRHPSLLFQCMWNSLWWIDSHEKENLRKGRPGSKAEPLGHSESEEWYRFQFMEAWRAWKEGRTPGFVWLRATTPPQYRSGKRFLLEGHENFVSAIDASDDGLIALSASADRTLRLWDISTATQIAQRSALAARMDRIRFCPGMGNQGAFLSADEEGTIFLWDAANLDLRGQSAAHRGRVRGMSVFSPGNWAVSGGSDGAVVVHELPTLLELARLKLTEDNSPESNQGKSEVFSVTIDPLTEEVVFTLDTDIYRWNWKQGECRQWLAGPAEGIYTLCEINRAGDRIAVWQIDQPDLESPTCGGVFTRQTLDELANLEPELQTDEFRERASFWENSTQVGDLRFSPDGQVLAISDYWVCGVWYWVYPDRFEFIDLPSRFPEYGGVTGVAFVAGGYVLCVTRNQTLQAMKLNFRKNEAEIVRRQSRQKINSPQPTLTATDILLDPRGRYFIAWQRFGLLDRSSLKVLVGNPKKPDSYRHVSTERSAEWEILQVAALSGNGNRVVFGTSSGLLHILDQPYLETCCTAVTKQPNFKISDIGKENWEFQPDTFTQSTNAESDGITVMGVSQMGGLIAVANHQGVVTTCQDHPHERWVSSPCTSPITVLKLSEDETLLAVGEDNGTVSLLRTSDGGELGKWTCPEFGRESNFVPSVVFLQFDSLNARLVCGFDNGRLRWLDLKTGEWSELGRVKILADFESLIDSGSGQGYRVTVKDDDLALISPETKQAIAWAPRGVGNFQDAAVDHQGTVLIAFGDETRFYAREGHF